MTDKLVAANERAHRAKVKALHHARRVRDMGRVRYFALYGAGKWGLIITALLVLSIMFFAPSESRAPLFSVAMPRFIGWWLFLWPAGIVGGVVAARGGWRTMEQYWFPILDGQWPE